MTSRRSSGPRRPGWPGSGSGWGGPGARGARFWGRRRPGAAPGGRRGRSRRRRRRSRRGGSSAGGAGAGGRVAPGARGAERGCQVAAVGCPARGADPVGEVATGDPPGVEARPGILPPAERAPLPGPLMARVAPLLAGVPGAQPRGGPSPAPGSPAPARSPWPRRGPTSPTPPGVAAGGPRGDPGVHVENHPARAGSAPPPSAAACLPGALWIQNVASSLGAKSLGPEEVGGNQRGRAARWPGARSPSP